MKGVAKERELARRRQNPNREVCGLSVLIHFLWGGRLTLKVLAFPVDVRIFSKLCNQII